MLYHALLLVAAFALAVARPSSMFWAQNGLTDYRIVNITWTRPSDGGPWSFDDARSTYMSSVNTTNLTLNFCCHAVYSWGSRPFRQFQKLSIRHLDLSNNRLNTIDAVALADLPDVIGLDLRDNAIESLYGRPFRSVPKLLWLDLRGNKICSLAGASLADLSELQHLNLEGNRIVALEDADFRGLSRLRTLDLCENDVRSVSAGAFRDLTGLEELAMSANPVAGTVVSPRLERIFICKAGLKTVPASLTRSVRTLDLSRNNLTTLTSGDFDSYPLLQTLRLASNKIETVEDDALGRLESLLSLDLSDNLLRIVPPGLPANLSILRLHYNRIETLSFEDFQELGQLRELSLAHNLLRELPAGVFRSLHYLQILDLTSNPLITLHADALEGLLSLQKLRLGYLRSLKRPASWLPFPAVYESLTLIDVSESPVLADQLLADTAALTALHQLKSLYMSHCGLSTLRQDLPSLLKQLEDILLEDNPWHCEESLLKWLPAWQCRLSMYYTDPVCASPSSLRNRSLCGPFGPGIDAATQTSVEQNPNSTTTVRHLSLSTTTTGNTPSPTSGLSMQVDHEATTAIRENPTSLSTPLSEGSTAATTQYIQTAAATSATATRNGALKMVIPSSPTTQEAKEPSKSTLKTPNATEEVTFESTSRKSTEPTTTSIINVTFNLILSKTNLKKLKPTLLEDKIIISTVDSELLNRDNQVLDYEKKVSSSSINKVDFKTQSNVVQSSTSSFSSSSSINSHVSDNQASAKDSSSGSTTNTQVRSSSSRPTSAANDLTTVVSPSTGPSTTSYTVSPSPLVSSTTGNKVVSTSSSTSTTNTMASPVTTNTNGRSSWSTPTTNLVVSSKTENEAKSVFVKSTTLSSTIPTTDELPHVRMPPPPPEALTAEHPTSSLLAMLGVGAVGSALVLLVLAAVHAGPRHRFRLHPANLSDDASATREEDEHRTDLW